MILRENCGWKARSVGQKTTRKMILAVATFSIIEALTHFGNANPFRGSPSLGFDSPFYIRMLYYLSGRVVEPPVPPFSMRPLIPALALPLSTIIGINNAFGAVNTILWALASVAFFKYCLHATGDSKLALYASLLFSSSVPVLVYGGAIGTDMAGYLFLIVGLFLVLRRRREKKVYVLEGVVIGVGLLCRETTSILIPLIAVVRIIRDRLPVKEMLEELLTVSLIAALPVIAWWLTIPNPGYTQFFAENLAVAFTYAKLEKAVYQIMLTFHVGYAFFLAGFLKENDDKALIENYLVLGVVATYFVTIYFIGILSSRFVFLAFPALLPVGAKGILSLADNFSKKPVLSKIRRSHWELILLAAYVLISNIGTARYNICFPALSDAPIKKLLPP